jgi:hypothetical protein
MPAATALLAAALAVGCATPAAVAFLPYSASGTEPMALVGSGAMGATLASGVRLAIQPTWRRQTPADPAFTLRIVNGSAMPWRITRDDVQATFRGEPVALALRHERLRLVQVADDRREALRVAIGTVAVVAALWGIAGGWDGALVTASGSVVIQTPLAGLAAGIAVAGAGEEALQRFDIDDPVARRAVADAILEARTVGPGQGATVQVVLDRCCSGRLRADDAIRIAITVGAETAVFEFLRVPADEPTRLLPP